MDEQIDREPVAAIMSNMPDDLRSEGVSYCQELSGLIWKIGDWVNRVTLLAVADGLTQNKKDVAAACAAIIAYDWGADSLYEFARAAEFYHGEAERRLAEVLPFNHMRYAMKFGEEGSKVVLDADIRAMDDCGGGVQSLDRLKLQYEPHIAQLRAHQPGVTVIPGPLTLAPDESETVRRELISHLEALDRLLEKALVVDAEGAVLVARASTLIHKALKRIVISVTSRKE